MPDEQSQAIPDRPFGKLAMLSATHNTAERVVRVECLFRDERGDVWRTDNVPCFAFDMEFVRHEGQTNVDVANLIAEYVARGGPVYLGNVASHFGMLKTEARMHLDALVGAGRLQLCRGAVAKWRDA